MNALLASLARSALVANVSAIVTSLGTASVGLLARGRAPGGPTAVTVGVATGGLLAALLWSLCTGSQPPSARETVGAAVIAT